jgi:hypothetical protein
MESWYRDRLYQKELVLLSDTGFTSNTLALRFLEHFIQYTGAGRDKPPKLLLMDNHGSHITPEFIDLATRHNIVPFSFPAHLTHCMQPCDVGIFQSYKHWHSKAIQYALETLDFEYIVSSFLRDLAEVRSRTFKKSTIKSAFEKAKIKVHGSIFTARCFSLRRNAVYRVGQTNLFFYKTTPKDSRGCVYHLLEC